MNNTSFYQEITTFLGNSAPEEGFLAGYTAIINSLELNLPFPLPLILISKKNRKYDSKDWKVFPNKYLPEDSLYKQLVFALKYEGINLLFFKKLFTSLSKTEIHKLITIEPTGQYSRKIWFLYEWLMSDKLEIPDIKIKNYIPLIDDKLQFAIEGTHSSRHRIINNLPGSQLFCPLIRKTPKLIDYIQKDLGKSKSIYLNTIHKDVLQRAASFLLLKDSKASFTIEGENPSNNRALKWGKAIGQAGSNSLNVDELLRLQQLVIESARFTKMGLRKQPGFVGEHDRNTGEPIPDHISAKWEDIEVLINGLIQTYNILLNSNFNPVLAATVIAFGFVFIHPFVDGNGRIHRYLIHHILAEMKFSQQGIIFPVSSSILDHINDYRKILEAYSHPILEHIQWTSSNDNNIIVLNDTTDFYKYFDATLQAEFLFDCVYDTFENVIPKEVDYLENYDAFKTFIDNHYEMPDKLVATLVRFLQQNNGKLSKRAMNKEFKTLEEKEVKEIEIVYNKIFFEN